MVAGRSSSSKDPRRERPYAPGMMVGLLTYAYYIGALNSPKIARGNGPPPIKAMALYPTRS